MPTARSAAAAVPVPTSFPSLVSPSHKRYASTISKLNDSYARTAAAQKRRVNQQQQQAARDAHLAHLAQQSSEQQLQRQFLFREHILATVNHSKTRRIQLECESGLRQPEATKASADWPRFETVDVRVEEWRCSGAKTRVLEEEGWIDEEKAREAVERVQRWQQHDRERELRGRQDEQQQRHAAIHERFTQQREVNQSRAAYICHHFAATQPYHLTPPAAFLDSVRGRQSRLDERREGDDGSSGRGSVLSTGRGSERLPRLNEKSSATADSALTVPLSNRRRASHTYPSLPTIADEEHGPRRHTFPRPHNVAKAITQQEVSATVEVEQREDEYTNCTFVTDTSSTRSNTPPAHLTLPASQPTAALDPPSPLQTSKADALMNGPTPVVSYAVHSELERFESKLPQLHEKEKLRGRPLYLTKHPRQHH